MMYSEFIGERAAAWFVKAQDGLSDAQEHELHAWLEQNPLHQEAYDDYASLWQEMNALTPTFACTKPSTKRVWWKYASAAIVLLCLALGFQWHRMSTHPTYAQHLSSPIGSMKSYTLEDGTTLFLDTNTEVDVRYYASKRLISLEKGQIHLVVSKDEKRPLLVETQTVQVRVTGTRFEVRHVDETVRVSVEEGSVDVSYKRLNDGSIIKLASLGAKDQILLDARGFMLSKTVLSNDSIALWRSGRLVFEKTPLQEVLFEFERYGTPLVKITAPSLAKMPLTGSFDIERFSDFLETLPKVLPLKVTYENHQATISQK